MSYYTDREPTYKVNVLGTEYSIYMDVPPEADDILESFDGYCDFSVARIAVCERSEDSDIADYAAYQKRVMRHELIHAFLYESGLGADAAWQIEGQAHPEQTVDWIARQFPKMLQAFREVGAL